MYKKILCAVLVLALSVSMMACGKKQAESKDPSDPDNSVATSPVESQATEPNMNDVVENDTKPGEISPIEPEAEDNTTAPIEPTESTTEKKEPEVQMGVEKGDESPDIEDEDPTQSTKPKETTPKETKPKETKPGSNPDDKKFDLTKLTYEGYNALSGEDQKKVIDMFGSTDDFMRWYKAVEAKYKAEHPEIEIGADGKVDAGAVK